MVVPGLMLQLVLGFLTCAAALGDADYSNNLSGLIPDRERPVADPFQLAIRRLDAIFGFDLLALHLPHEYIMGLAPVLRHDGFQPQHGVLVKLRAWTSPDLLVTGAYV